MCFNHLIFAFLVFILLIIIVHYFPRDWLQIANFNWWLVGSRSGVGDHLNWGKIDAHYGGQLGALFKKFEFSFFCRFSNDRELPSIDTLGIPLISTQFNIWSFYSMIRLLCQKTDKNERFSRDKPVYIETTLCSLN